MSLRTKKTQPEGFTLLERLVGLQGGLTVMVDECRKVGIEGDRNGIIAAVVVAMSGDGEITRNIIILPPPKGDEVSEMAVRVMARDMVSEALAEEFEDYMSDRSGVSPLELH